MDELHKDDIEILDMIIKISLSKSNATLSDLPLKPTKKPEGEGFNADLVDNKLTYYPRYFKIIQKYKIAKVDLSKYQCIINAIPEITQRFYDNGGFKKEFKKQQEELKRTEILKRKEVDDAKLSKKSNKAYWVVISIAVIGLIITILQFLKAE